MILKETSETRQITFGMRSPQHCFVFMRPSMEVSNHATIVDWLKEVKHTSKEIQISSTSLFYEGKCHRSPSSLCRWGLYHIWVPRGHCNVNRLHPTACSCVNTISWINSISCWSFYLGTTRGLSSFCCVPSWRMVSPHFFSFWWAFISVWF